MALPKRIVKETERLMAEPYVCSSSLARHHRRCPADECRSVRSHRVPGISAVPHQDNLRYFDVEIHGPAQSPYEGLRPPRRPRDGRDCRRDGTTEALTRCLGGIFKLELFLPDDYPMTPPKIRFLTKIFHPNVDKLGRICLDVLKSTAPRPPRPLLLPALLAQDGPRADQAACRQTTGPLLCRSEPSSSPSRPSSAPPTPTTPSPQTWPRAGRRMSRLPLRRPKSGPTSMHSREWPT